MMDSLETNETTALEQSSEITNEQQVEPAVEVAEQAEPAVEAAVPEAEESKPEVEVSEAEQHTIEQTFKTKDEVVARVKEIAESGEAGDRAELNLLKQLFYKFHNAEVQEAFKAFVEAGGEEDKFMPELDQAEPAFREAMQTIRERRAAIQETLEKQKQDNLKRKLEILERIQQLASTPEEANQNFDEFKALQTEWKEIKAVPAERATELWKNYQLYVEQYYDLLKLGHELRDYDFKKNLETKMRLIQQAEALAENPDVLQAFNQLQTLHQEWKETGPVAKEIREDVWAKFKEASTVINKKHQAYFDAIKAREEENLTKKTALCEQLEAFETDGLKTFADWDGITQKIKELQAEWKTIGFAPQKMNTAIFERFRQGCDAFFEKKNAFFKDLKEELNTNLAKKKELVEKAEALMESTDWRSTGDILINLQKQWKEIGTVPRKYSEDLWKRFTSACDHFFEARQAATADVRNEEKANKEQKLGIIDQLKQLAETEGENVIAQVKELQQKWSEVGHVPFRDKEKLYKEYRELCDKIYDAYGVSQAKRRLDGFRKNLAEKMESAGSSLENERQKMQRAYERMTAEIKTYENNIGFLNAGSKKGNSLVEAMNKKVEKLRSELNLLAQKIKAVDEQMREE
ncbi:MAG: DUF349 domain-containing protein [Bacteroidaceae bacterium]|nr:DUF349 domain-containing protein [Bacteroidaceae bacterium]MBQ9170057.1 DUF349 domain-containing protein [Bacteroidaceae bacterium]